MLRVKHADSSSVAHSQPNRRFVSTLLRGLTASLTAGLYVSPVTAQPAQAAPIALKEMTVSATRGERRIDECLQL